MCVGSSHELKLKRVYSRKCSAFSLICQIKIKRILIKHLLPFCIVQPALSFSIPQTKFCTPCLCHRNTGRGRVYSPDYFKSIQNYRITCRMTPVRPSEISGFYLSLASHAYLRSALAHNFSFSFLCFSPFLENFERLFYSSLHLDRKRPGFRGNLKRARDSPATCRSTRRRMRRQHPTLLARCFLRYRGKEERVEERGRREDRRKMGEEGRGGLKWSYILISVPARTSLCAL